MNRINLSFIILLFPVIVCAQPLNNRAPYDLTKDKVLYTIGYSHLDTEWNWDYPTSINEFIRNIMTENFYLFEKYPEYVFNFTGARRYEMMKEYYPDLYRRVTSYIQQGRWYVAGSSMDEGEVNISSSESLIRQVLYGNNFFRSEFGKESQDYMIPDCFGFLANLPSVLNHCGLKGFSTQKLTWHSANGIPFNVGTWIGPDGKGILAALNATDYTGKVQPRLDLDEKWEKRLNDDFLKTGYTFDYRYYGVGDMGGAPRVNDVKNAIGSLHNKDSKFQVVLTSSDQMFKDITPEIQQKLPTYSGDLLLIEHSAGSLTSQAFMKRMNRKNELLAQSAELLASFAENRHMYPYPFRKLNSSWALVLGSQFHDILPGTSIPKAYEYAWNDEYIAAEGFSEVLKKSASLMASELNTQVSGKAVVVFNPVSIQREDIVTADLEYEKLPEQIEVFGPEGKAVPSQILEKTGNKIRFIFLARVPSTGLAVFDVRETQKVIRENSNLKVIGNTLENEYYKVTIDSNGDIANIFDKKNHKEVLSSPARLEFQSEESFEWPAWNMQWDERKKPPFDFMNKEVSIKVKEQGAVRIGLEIKRKGQNSEITQLVSLTTGEPGKRIEVSNQVNWQSKGVSLKAAFPLTVKNPLATYNLGVGTLQRGNNQEKQFEVPSKEWFDLTDHSSGYGVSILEDCKFGSDKPADNTVRLTLLFTPKPNKRYVVQGSQDWGVHEFKYGIYPHRGSWEEAQTPWQGKFLNQPLLAFESPKHKGSAGKSFSLINIVNPNAGIMAFKKMEHGEYYILRVNELSGLDNKDIVVHFPGEIADAFEVNGQEQKMGSIAHEGSNLKFDLSHYTIRSFAVKFKTRSTEVNSLSQTTLDLPYNLDVFSNDENREDGNFDYRVSYPAELIPEKIISENIEFKMGSKEDNQNNAINCNGQTIELPRGQFNKIYILAAAKKDTTGTFQLGDVSVNLKIQNWSGYIGQFYNRNFASDQITVTSITPPFVKTDNIAWFASHKHLAYPSKNDAYQYCHMYKYCINLPANTKSITLPQNNAIRILAITLANEKIEDIKPLGTLYDIFPNAQPVILCQ